MKKVLLIQNTISKYRVPVYNILSKKYEIDAISSYGDVPQGVDFDVRTIPTHDLWKFTVHDESLFKIAQNYDVVLGLFSPTWTSISTLPIRPLKKYKFIPWGIGVPASYSVHYDDHAKSTKPLEWMIKKSDAVIFYSDYPVKKYASMGLDAKKMFVAHNTVQVLPLTNDSGKEKNTILFIGTLYKSKGIMSLLECYKELAENNVPEIPLLRIVGSGDEFDGINQWISDNNLQPLVKLEGEIYDEDILRDYFQKAIVCISPGQAGYPFRNRWGTECLLLQAQMRTLGENDLILIMELMECCLTTI
jgi:glycosyltransferase involved in cell wall biosynthesis